MTKLCDRPPTNAEIFYKIFHEWLDFWWKFIKLIFQSKLHSTMFVLAICCGIMFFSAHLKFADCLEGAKYLLTFL
jgi:hypothetical protein